MLTYHTTTRHVKGPYGSRQGYINPLTEQKKALQAEIDSLNINDSEISAKDAIEVVKNFSDIVARGNFEELRLVVETLIKQIVIDEDEIIIYWRFE